MDVPTVTLDDLPGACPDSMVVLDVREQSEWVHGHIDGAHHIPLSELGGRLADVPDEQAPRRVQDRRPLRPGRGLALRSTATTPTTSPAG